MIRLKIGTNTSSTTAIVEPTRTIKSLLEEHNVDYSRGGVHLDGLAIAGADLNKTLEEHGVEESGILICVVKGDGGVK